MQQQMCNPDLEAMHAYVDAERFQLQQSIGVPGTPEWCGTQHRWIHFTVEVESDGQLPFLDVLLLHDPDDSINVSVPEAYRHTDRYLDFSSHDTLAHKIAVVRTLHTRAESINSSVLGNDEETKFLRQALTSNGYP